ncbi:hypothetical protein FHS04_000872 [Mesoflavibacter sabulilitoris]|uniref:CAAX prenyl protease 2/Lysostaphin resistance protein A-like domain-containing protein n=1 Tax=Mesoflavibacter zeaxanthinifaciens subsp. sabulilitoris TaxID=1520893 RepID=A0A2T1N5Z7_9FLAO|nr:type II CAAX endopeptidase family protein [Mesoflavibacter zeaxanthinifaciens]MBB3123375.1 hypothetical protein [Mesoflavibacter zeaxanthinifaciens subsp. sabulilitoris]PSG86993.1 hypothetical protein C7H61_12850 [Mesoflavibacter zeaxanthinifaciens subsp. sabulilitoris]
MKAREIILVIFVFFLFVITSIGIGFFFKSLNYDGAFYINMEITFLIFIFILIKKWKIDIIEKIKKVSFIRSIQISILSMILLLLYPVINLPNLITSISDFKIGIMEPEIFHFETHEQIPINQYYYITRLVLISPILEELFYRGILYSKIRLNASGKTSIIISSLLFGLSHPGSEQFFVTFIGGLILGVLYEKNKNLLECILLHIFMNTLTLFFKINYTTENHFLICLIYLTLIIGGIFILKNYILKVKPNE